MESVLRVIVVSDFLNDIGTAIEQSSEIKRRTNHGPAELIESSHGALNDACSKFGHGF